MENINETQYYFDSKGWMKTGRHNIVDDTYFFATSGERQTINRRALVFCETSTRAVSIEDVNTMEKGSVTKTLVKLFVSLIKLSPRLLQKCKNCLNLLAKAM